MSTSLTVYSPEQRHALRLAKLKARSEASQANIILAKELAKNPIVELLAGLTALELLHRYPKGNPILDGGIIGGLKVDVMEGGLFAVVAFQQLAPSMPYLAD